MLCTISPSWPRILRSLFIKSIIFPVKVELNLFDIFCVKSTVLTLCEILLIYIQGNIIFNYSYVTTVIKLSKQPLGQHSDMRVSPNNRNRATDLGQSICIFTLNTAVDNTFAHHSLWNLYSLIRCLLETASYIPYVLFAPINFSVQITAVLNVASNVRQRTTLYILSPTEVLATLYWKKYGWSHFVQSAFEVIRKARNEGKFYQSMGLL